MKSVLGQLFVCGVNVLCVAGIFVASTVCLAGAPAKASTTAGDVAGAGSASPASGKFNTGMGNYSSSSRKIITPQIVNEVPVIGLNPVTFERQRNSTWKIRISELLSVAEVSDPDGDPLSVVAVSSPTTNGGVVVISGEFIYYTPPGTNGNLTDSFTYTVRDTYWATADGMVVLTVPALPPAGAVISPDPTNGVVRVRFNGIPGQLYLIQRATNMVQPVYWTTLTNVVANAFGRFEYIDTAPPPGGAFYRAVAP